MARRKQQRRAARGPRTPQLFRAAESFGHVTSVMGVFWGAISLFIFVVVGIVMMTSKTTTSSSMWIGLAVIAMGAVIFGGSLMNYWATKKSREYAAVSGGIGAIGMVRGALVGPQHRIGHGPGTMDLLRL